MIVCVICREYCYLQATGNWNRNVLKCLFVRSFEAAKFLGYNQTGVFTGLQKLSSITPLQSPGSALLAYHFCQSANRFISFGKHHGPQYHYTVAVRINITETQIAMKPNDRCFIRTLK